MLASPGLSTTRDDGSGASAMRWGLFRSCLLASAVFRLGLTLYGIHQDARSTLKYTDADYAVFSDAAWFVLHPGAETLAKGPVTRRLGLKVGTPYHRATYRYPPVLAVLLTPNHLLFSAWGKVLFSISDLVVGWLLYRILRRRSLTESKATAWVGGVWLLNPIVANISTRGSSEAILGALIVSSIAAAESGRWDASAVFLGLATHFKIYPVVYAASIWTALGKGQGLFELSPARLRYAAIAGATLHLLTSAMYSIWGKEFLEHSYLYHIGRRDHRHNFSPYFYQMYLTYPSPGAPPADLSKSFATKVLRHPLTSFVPQLGLSLALGAAFGARDLPFAWFLQTFAFVAFNKVATSQYFMWYLWLLPLVLPRLRLSAARAAGVLTAWILGQALWLSQAFRLEIRGDPVYVEVWLASVAFLLANAWVLGCLVDAYDPKPILSLDAKQR